MKRLVLITALVSANAMALDFDTEWAKFKDDFARLVHRKEVSPEPKPALAAVEDGEVKRVDPKSPERIGLKVDNPELRAKLKDLYNRDDVVVYSTTVR